MTAPISETSGRIFIGYRREDTAFVAASLRDRLLDHFGKGKVFTDVNDIAPGADFEKAIVSAIGSCRVFLALIGDRWLTITDGKGKRHLEKTDDWVRREIEAAFEHNVLVIPVLAGAAGMPRADELPTSMAMLARRQAFELRPAYFRANVDELVKILEGALAGKGQDPLGFVEPGPMPETGARKLLPRDEARMGAIYDGKGTNFSLFSSAAERVTLCLVDEGGKEERINLPERSASVWGGYLEGVHPGQLYGYRVHGPYSPDKGIRCNPSKLLLDPYARAICGQVKWGQEVFSHDLDDEARVNMDDSIDFMPRSVVAGPQFDWSGDVKLNVPLSDSVIYEAHVKGLTYEHPDIPDRIRGTYAGLAHPAMVEHYKHIGVTAIQLMPIQQFVQDGLLLERGLSNYWGYNTIGFFAPHGSYCSSGEFGGQVTEFKEMTRALHLAGIEIILDVVFNHTAEGNHVGPMLSFRGIDNAAYYRLDSNPFYYTDYTGTGNTVNTLNSSALQLVMDSLRYWVEEMHVDGFRFDLCAALARVGPDFDQESPFFSLVHQDPVLADVKLIAEPWDTGTFGYQVGNFPARWSELNGLFRDCVRDYWRGTGRGQILADRIGGSPDLYKASRRRPYASINFITSHDGFTLMDLVSYEQKHNENNGHDNEDGTDDNRSWNCGAEGPTDDPDIRRIRTRQRKNLLTSLMLSQGVPLLLAGDELGRTQQGNNNAYCQDNSLSWVDWNGLSTDQSLAEFVAKLTRLRRDHPVFRRRRYTVRRPVARSGRLPDMAWLLPSGDVIHDWDETSGPLGMFLNGQGIPDEDAPEGHITDDSFILFLNPVREEQEVRLPGSAYGESWEVIIDTADEQPAGEPAMTYSPGSTLRMSANSTLVLRRLP